MRNMRSLAPLVAALFVLAAPCAQATDEWDLATQNDDNTGTENLLVHGVEQRHDLQAKPGPVADIDLYRLNTKANRSYEARVFNVSGDTNLAATRFQRLAPDGTTVLQTSSQLVSGINFNFALRWIQLTDELPFIRVTGLTTNTATSDYSISFRESTLYCPRFNNSGTQVSVLILQGSNPDTGLCSYRATFVNEGSAVIGTVNSSVDASDIDVVSLSTVTGLAGQRGGAFIAHNCGYGGMKGKLVALEPATGFSFDTPCTPREY